MRGKYFLPQELWCQHCHEEGCQQDLVDRLDEMREIVNRPIRLTSAFRCVVHDKSAEIKGSGRHTSGYAADIEALTGAERFAIVESALQVGMTSIGIGKTFVHVDCCPRELKFPHRVIWLY